MRSESDKAASKAKRKDQEELNYRVATAAKELESRLNKDMQAEAERLGVDISALRSRFLMYASHRCDTRPTVWNGLVHVKSEEWAEMKDIYPGRAFLAYVVERIHSEDLYNLAEMSEEDQDMYIRAAQDARKAKLDAGVAKTSSERFVQGTVKHEISAICNRLEYLHAATSIECLLLVVKGRAQDGLAPTYHASDKARTFLESHLKAPVTHLLDLMESSSIGGSAALTLRHKNQTQVIKTQVRRKMLESCRIAVTSVAEDGSPPAVTDRLDIGAVEYKNYLKFVEEYKTVMVGWPFKPDGALIDPSSMGLGKLEKLLKLLENPDSGCGFKRQSENEWKEWMEKRDQDVASGKIKLPTRKTRNDAGRKRKREVRVEGNGEANSSSQTRKESIKPKSKGAPASKKRSTQATKQKKSPASNRRASSDSPQEACSGAGLDHLSHANAPEQQVDSQVPAPTELRFSPPPASDILRDSPPPDFPPGARTTFDFNVTDAHPTAPKWPIGTQSRPSTPQASNFGLNLNKSGAPRSPRSQPSTPQRGFRFVLSTPEREAARANSPRRARSRSPAVSASRAHTTPGSSLVAVDFPLDPNLISARIDIPRATSK